MGGGGARTKQKSHIISYGHFWRPPRNVAIATTLLHDLKYPQGNYVRNCLGRSGGRRRGRRAWPRCWWAAAGPGRAAHSDPAPLVWRAPEGPEGTGGLRVDAPSEARGADGSRAGRRPPAHTAARPAEQNARRPEHPWGHKQRKRAAAHQGRRAFTQLVRTQRSRAATTSATWTAFRAAPLRRLSPETTKTRPRLPSTA